MKKVTYSFIALCTFLGMLPLAAQEDNPFMAYEVPYQNLLKFNRFLINPTFSTVREDKSYINFYHRNQSVAFDDNYQDYFLAYSGRIGDRSGVGLGAYNERVGTISNFGVLANYAYGLKLSDKSNFTFGANLSYYNSGFDENRANPIEDDPYLNGFQDSSLLTFQPGFNISYGAFDFGVFAENLFDYNLKTSESITSFDEKTFSGHLQYTHQFKKSDGILENGRLMPLARARHVGDDGLHLGGSLILDLPKLGWAQFGYDDYYGVAGGIGFNINKRISIGYTMEKGITNTNDNFGLTHEISFAYSFTPNLTEDRVLLEDGYEGDLVENQTDPSIRAKDAEIDSLKRALDENNEILAELMFRQDSIEVNRQQELERRFDLIMRMVRNETKGSRPDIEEKVRKMYYPNNPQVEQETAVALQEELEQSEPLADAGKENPTRRNNPKNTVAKDKLNNTNTKAKPISSTKQVSSSSQDSNAYYMVANVYKGGKYLDAFVEELVAQGLDPKIYDNPRNGLKYVYLKQYNSWSSAAQDHGSAMNGQYSGELWIMKVKDGAGQHTRDEAVANTSQYQDNVLKKNVNQNAGTLNVQTVTATSSGTEAGFYIIANVFSRPSNANRFIKLLNQQGLSAGYITNPKNNYRYVYIKKHSSWNNALSSYYSKLNGAYNDSMWIMRVKPNRAS